jgi:arylsulfatase A-like enzyme
MMNLMEERTGVASAPARAGHGRAGDLVLNAAWLGLVTGLLELALLFARMHVYSKATLGALQMNRHFPWMIPVANLMIFGGCGLVLGLAARFWPRTVPRLAASSLGFLSALTLLLGVQRLHPAACIVLALALTFRIAPRFATPSPTVGRLVRASLPVLVLVVLVLAGVTYDRVARAEQRARASLPAARPDVPNVLLIVLDTVRADHLSLSGYARDTSPNLARLAGEGVRLENARSTAPWTLPSHASMFTGRWPHQLFTGPHQPMSTAAPTLAEFLRDRGYETAGFVANNYFCNSWFGLGRGFVHYEDHFDGDLLVSPAAILRCSELGKRLLRVAGRRFEVAILRKDAARVRGDFLDWLSERRGGRPFFAFLNFVDAHDPYLVPAGFDRHFGVKPEGAADYATLVNWPRRDKRTASARDVALVRDAYDDCIAALDEQLGHLFDALRRRDLFRNTLIIVTADHGESLGERGFYGHAMSLYRPEVAVPLLILGPSGVPKGRVIGETVSLRDLPATVLDRLGLEAGSPFPGRTLARCWDPARAPDRAPGESILSETGIGEKPFDPRSRVPALRGPLRALAAGPHVYIRGDDGGEELFDLDSDPSESHNLARAPGSRPVLDRFRDDLARRFQEERSLHPRPGRIDP